LVFVIEGFLVKNVKKYSKILYYFGFCVVLPCIVFAYILNVTVLFFPHVFSRLTGFLITSPFDYVSVFLKIAWAIVFSISDFLFAFGFFYFVRLLRQYYKGYIFVDRSLSLLRTISRVALTWTIYQPIQNTLRTLILTFHLGHGKRKISLPLASKDIFNIFVVFCFLIITSLMYEGYKLKKEQDLTV
jgi:hypothetical protein